MARHSTPTRPGDVPRRGPLALLAVAFVALAVAVILQVWQSHQDRRYTHHEIARNDRQFCELLGSIAPTASARPTSPYGKKQAAAVIRLYQNLGCTR